MTTMTNAMRDSGMKLPSIKYRIWHWLKDHPEKTAEEISKALGLKYTCSVEMLDLYRRGMATVFKDKSHKKGITAFSYMVKRYSVVNVKEFELLPLPDMYKTKKEPAKTPPKLAVVAKPAAPKPEEAPAPQQKQEAPRVIHAAASSKRSAMTEAEQFAAYLEFKALMKEMGK